MISTTILAVVFAAELALVALSFNLSYRIVGFANFAHVEFVTVGAFVAVSASASMPLAAAGACGVVAAGALAVGLNLTIFQHLRQTSIGTRMIASAGAAIAIRGLVQYVWGVNVRRFEEPTRTFSIGGTDVSVVQIVIVAASVASVIAFALVLKFTPIGRSVRAVADDLVLTEVRGVRSNRVLNYVWFISGALAGLAGVLIGLDTFVRPELGTSLLVPMFAAAIVGGVGSPFGAILGAALVSGAETSLVSIDVGNLFGSGSHYLGSQYKSVVAFALLIVVLTIKPSGFFGEARTRA